MNKSRTLTLISGALILFCLGIIYIWSIFNKPVSAYFNNWAESSYTFNIMLVTFVLGILIGGRIQDKKGPRIVVLWGGILFAVGILLASVTPSSLPWLFAFAYGGLAGFGVGMAYTSTVSCVQKWFPDRRGLASGVMVSAFGVSTVAFGPLASSMLTTLSVGNTLQILAIAFFAVVIIFVWFIKNPPEGYMSDVVKAKSKAAPVAADQFSPGEALRTKEMYFIIICMAMLTLSYFIINPKITQMSGPGGKNFADLAVITISLSGVASALGRLLIPILSDFKGRKFAFMLLFIIILVSMVLMIFVSGPVCMVLIWAISFCYGASAGVFPALTADYYGVKNMGANYGLVMIGFAGAAVLAMSISSIFISVDAVSSFAFIIPVIACVIGIVFMAILKPPSKAK
jgi:OFA family oxalate/formate antiporter-like MFS transporter